MAKLYIVPTPIGNLDDITLRAVNVLREVDFILAEDTRTTSFLLRHLGIEKKLHSHHKFNEHATVKMVAGSIAAGRNAALVSDAGTPGISDPGFLEQFAEVFGPGRRVSVSRELTKKFEQTVRGTVAEVLEHFRTTEPKGEFVIVLAGKPKPGRETQGDGDEQKIGYDE